jgi:polysaccharide export outer membrane protein
VALIALIGLGALGCMPRPMPPPVAPPLESYVVGAPDVLEVNILPEPEILREVRVRPDGQISIDLIGDVQAAGRTPTEIARAIEQEIIRYKRDAAVNVTVVDSPSQFVTVYGEVARPGIFPLASETRVSEAIGRVGGTRPFASLNNVRVIRTFGDETEVIEIRLADIQKGDLSSNIVINEGDLIVVPPTALARVGYALQMLFFPFQPIVSTLSAVGTTAAGVNTISGF